MRWLLVVVDGEDVLPVWLLLEDCLDHSSEVGHVDGWDAVVTIADVGEPDWILKPGFLDVLVEDGLSLAIEDTGRDDVGLDVSSLTLEVEDFIFNLFDDLVFGNWASLLVIKLCIWQKLISFPNLFWNFDDFFLWRRLRFFLFRTLFFLFLL